MKTRIINLLCLAIGIFPIHVIGQSIDSLKQIAIHNNPQLKAVEMEYQGAITKQNQVDQLPNPQIGLGVPVLPPETRLGPQVMMISATQMFPWFGTLDAKSEVMLAISKAKYEELAVIKLDLYFQLESAYYQLIFLNKKQEYLSKVMESYQSIESVALAKVEAGQYSVADVLRIQVKQDEIETRLIQLQNEKIAVSTIINQLINTDNDEIIQATSSLDYHLMEYDLDAFRTKIGSYHPLIKKLDHQIEASQGRVTVNENANKPTIGLGIDYNMVAPRTDANPMNNGRDILVTKLMVTVPIYRKSYQATIQEEQFTQEALSYQKENLTDKMVGKIVGYKANYDNAMLNETLAQNQLQKMKSAYEILLSDYSAGKGKFEDLLTTMTQIDQLELNIYLSQFNMGMAKANIERITNF